MTSRFNHPTELSSVWSSAFFTLWRKAIISLLFVVFAAQVSAQPAPPIINAQPASITVTVGKTALFAVQAMGMGLQYQWKKNGTDIAGATNQMYSIPSVVAGDAGSFQVLVSSSGGSLLSESATLTITDAPTSDAPTITTQPASQTVSLGANVTFNVVASGSGTLSYQWSKGGLAISGATNASYVIASATVQDSGVYTVTVMCNSVPTISNPATLTVGMGAGLWGTFDGLNTEVTVDGQGSPVWTSVKLTNYVDPIVKAGGGDHLSNYLFGPVDWRASAATLNLAAALEYSAGSTSAEWRMQASDPAPAVGYGNTCSLLSMSGTQGVQFGMRGFPSSQTVANGAFEAGVLHFCIDDAAGSIYRGTALTANHWYEIKLDIDFSAASPTGSLSYRDLTAGSTSFTADTLLQKIDLKLTAVSGKYTFTHATAIVFNGAKIDELFASAAITVTPQAPTFVQAPQAQSVSVGGTAAFSAVAAGVPFPTFQWLKGTTEISGATNAVLTLTNVQTTDAGEYSLRLTNTVGSITSAPVALTVGIPVPTSNMAVFDSNDEGWKIVSLGNLSQNIYTLGSTYTPTYASEGGMTGGYISATDPDSGDFMFSAPASFLGNRSDMAGGVLSYWLTHPSGVSDYSTVDVILVGGGMRLVWQGNPPIKPSTVWTRYFVPLSSSLGWHIDNPSGAVPDAATFQTVLSNLTALYIRGEYSWNTETTCLDYVLFHSLAPEWPVITAQPQSTTVGVGQTATFTVTATAPTLTFNWKKGDTYLTDGGNISGATTNTLTISSAQTTDVGDYSVVVTNGVTSVQSSTASLTVSATGTGPGISSLPWNKTAVVGGTVSFAITPTGDAPLSFVWKKGTTTLVDGGNISGAGSATLTLTNVQLADAGQYTITITNPYGNLSNTYALTVANMAPANDHFANAATIASTTATLSGTNVGATTETGEPDHGPLGMGGVEHKHGDYSVWWKLTPSENGAVNLSTTGTSFEHMVAVYVGTAVNSLVRIATGQMNGDGVVDMTFMVSKDMTYYIAVEGFWGATGPISFAVKPGTAVAPKINHSPYGMMLPLGSPAMFSVIATGTEPIRYQWKKDGTNISGATNFSYSITSVSATDAANYTVEVWNAVGTVTSFPAHLAIQGDSVPVFFINPIMDQTVTQGGTAYLTALINGTSPFVFQWRKGSLVLVDGGNISGTTTGTLIISNAQASDAGLYSCYVTNLSGSGTATSNAATLTVTQPAGWPTITAQPQNASIAVGGTANFSVTATGTTPLAYQWRKDGNPISGATNAALQITNAQSSDAGVYTVMVTNTVGTELSNTATLAVTTVSAPTISTQPASQLVNEGATVTISVVASGDGTLSYEWKKGTTVLVNSGPVSGSGTATLTISGVTLLDAGNYTVKVTNAGGSITSSVAKLTVVPQGVSGTHSSGGYVPGGTATVSVTITHNGQANSLGVEVLLPTGWSYASGTNEAETKPQAPDSGTLGWSYTTIPASPVTFTFTCNVPADQTGDKTLSAVVTMGFVGGAETAFLLQPDPLVVSLASYHSADTSKDWKIGVSELTRVIQLYNTRNGTTRTGCYLVVESGTSDGFGPDLTREAAAVVTLSKYHSADYGKDGKLSVSELTRVIQLYNTREGTSRTGSYHRARTGDAVHADGFAPGL